MKNILTLVHGRRKWLAALVCGACCMASFYSLLDGWVNWSGNGFGIPVRHRLGIDPEWLRLKGDMGYPVTLQSYVVALLSVYVLSAASLEDAAKLSAANLLGVVWLGFLGMSPDYIEPCTHDAVLVAVWLGGCAACARQNAVKVALWMMGGFMVFGVGELWHALGGSWCPLRESDKIGGVFWVACAEFLCSMSVLSNLMEDRLRAAEKMWRVWLAAAAISAILIGAQVKAFSWDLLGSFQGAELGWIFGAILPLFFVAANVVLSLVGGAVLAVKKFNGLKSKASHV